MNDEELGALVRKSVLNALDRKDRNEIREEVEREHKAVMWAFWVMAFLAGIAGGAVVGSLFPTFSQ